MNPEKLEDLKKTAEEYRKKLQIGVPEKERYSILEDAPYIIQVGAYTVGIDDDDGKTKLENVNYPTQFSRKAKDQIIRDCKFSNINGIVNPEVFTTKQWYIERLESIEMTLKLFE